MTELNIKNKNPYLSAKLVNIHDFNLEKLDIQVVGTDELGIYCIYYDKCLLY